MLGLGLGAGYYRKAFCGRIVHSQIRFINVTFCFQNNACIILYMNWFYFKPSFSEIVPHKTQQNRTDHRSNKQFDKQ